MAVSRPGAEGGPPGGKATPESGVEISDFLLHTCHDLKTALRSVRVHTELLVKERESGESQNFALHVCAILTDSGKLERLANGLAAYSLALQVDPASFVMAPLEVILRTELAMLGNELRESAGEVTYDPLPRVHGDPDRLRQLLDNLLRNALVHRGADAPRVHISARREGDNWRVSVRDNGPGLEPAYLERIFEPFERLRGQQALGTGLGLTICREIVKRHGGRIWAESELGCGTTMHFTLPIGE